MLEVKLRSKKVVEMNQQTIVYQTEERIADIQTKMNQLASELEVFQELRAKKLNF